MAQAVVGSRIEMSSSYRIAREAWQKETLAKTESKEAPRPRVPSLSGQADAEPLYGPDSVEGDLDARLGFPGKPPFTRGVQPNMFRGRLWTMRQYAGFGTAAEIGRAHV